MRIIRLVILLGVPVAAQWVNLPTPGIPRATDGKPDLSASAPKTAGGKPDFSGMWIPRDVLTCDPSQRGVQCTELPLTPQVVNFAAGMKDGLPYQPWAADLVKSRSKDVAYIDPHMRCMPPNFPRAWAFPETVKIFQTPAQLVILDEFNASYRQVFFDGRKLPEDMVPTWSGYSVAHWEGDTLVVESAGFNDRTWLDFAGHGHTEALRMTERYRRRDFGHLDLQVTLDDPKAYAKPWTVSAGGALAPDTELLEYVCAENEKDQQHLVGRTSEEKRVTVAPEILAQYVGVYEVGSPNAFDTRAPRNVFTITLVNGELLIDLQGKGKVPMIPLSETMFSPRLLGTYQFIKNEQGVVTHMLVHSAEEVLTAVRRR